MKNKKLINVMILVFALILILSTVVYAAPITDAFRGGLIRFNSFFENEGYAPYATTIDFVFFALLFTAIYMMGARYAFKEIKKPEQVIVILLGLMTAFLLVLADISATVLLPYIHWLFYLLLFLLFWWLLKGMQNKFWRFMLALLLTLLTIALIQGLYSYLSKPEVPDVSLPGLGIGGFFGDMFGSFKEIDFPERPGIPDFLRNIGPGSRGPSPLKAALPADEVDTEKDKPPPEDKGISRWWWLLLLIPILFALSKIPRKAGTKANRKASVCKAAIQLLKYQPTQARMQSSILII